MEEFKLVKVTSKIVKLIGIGKYGTYSTDYS